MTAEEARKSMSTRSRIGILNADGSVTSIYTHSDGYPDHNGRLLEAHYADEASIRALLALGDLSILGEALGEAHDFTEHHGDVWCLAYGRDRGETDVEAATHPVDAWPDCGQEFEYLFDAGRWTCRGGTLDGPFEQIVPVSDEIELSVFTCEPPAKVAAPDFDPRIDYPERYTEGPI